jgi:hypothetical protein
MIEDPEDPLHFEDPRGEKVSEKKKREMILVKRYSRSNESSGLIPNQYRLVSNSAAV